MKTFGHGMSVSVVKPKQTLGMAEDPSYAYCELQVGCFEPPLHQSDFCSSPVLVQVGRLTMEPSHIEANLEKALEVVRNFNSYFSE